MDADDAFMFYAIRENRIDLHGFQFSHQRKDTETLNRIALEGKGDVVAISVFNWAKIWRNYLMLPHGGSVGQNYGPVIIARDSFPLEQLREKRLAIPGKNTTAANVVRMLSPEQQVQVVPIDPFYAIFDSLEKGEVDAGLVIHEGRMCYEKMGFKKIVDIGEWWYQETGDPLPLGANVISRSLGKENIDMLNLILYRSIEWALANMEELIPYLQSIKSPLEKELGLADPMVIRQYLNLYANKDTLKYGKKERAAMLHFFDRAYKSKLIPEPVNLEFAELPKP